MNKIDLVVVFFESEIDLLKLLVKSIELYCDSRFVDKIYFINNSFDENLGIKLFNENIEKNLFIFKQRKKIINASDLIGNNKDSYAAQQALKLEISKMINKEYYLILDAKNHFIKPLTYDLLFDKKGFPVTHLQIHSGYLQTCLKESCNYLQVKTNVNKPVLPTVTPYFMITKMVRELLDYIFNKDNISLYELITKNNKITEFLLYYAFLEFKGGINKFYTIGKKNYATLFNRWPEKEEDIKRVLESTNNDNVFIFSIYMNRFSQLGAYEIDFITKMWVKYKLFNSIEDGKKFIISQKNLVRMNEAKKDNKVTIGRNNRLFIANDSNQVIKQHQGLLNLTDEKVVQWRRILEFRKAYCNSKGIDYYFLIAPDAHAIYKEDLPDLDKTYGKRPIEQLFDTLYDYSYVYYPLKEMIEAKKRGEVYHPADSHWTSFGAYIAYYTLFKNFRKKIYILENNDIEIFSKKGTGDLGEKFTPPIQATYTECVVKKPFAKKIWNNEVVNRGHMSLTINKNAQNIKCLLLTDSYGWKIQRFMAESFSKLFIVHSPLLEIDAIEAFKPDIVISLMAERFLIYPQKDLFDKSAYDFVKEKSNISITYDEIIAKGNER